PPPPPLFPYTTLFRSVHAPLMERRIGVRENGVAFHEIPAFGFGEQPDVTVTARHDRRRDPAIGVRPHLAVHRLVHLELRVPVRRSEEHTSELQSLAYL